jgi:hypothetical protein
MTSACSFTCNTGYTLCNGACVDFQTDNNNCGGCGSGHACAAGYNCLSGACSPGFSYTPSNFTPSTYNSDVPSSATTIASNCTYTSGSQTAAGTANTTYWTCGGTLPYIIPNVTQTTGPKADILVFEALTIDSGVTLTLKGTNPVILAVWGNVVINGTISANASGATPGAGGNNATYCGTGSNATGQQGSGCGGSRAVVGGNGNVPSRSNSDVAGVAQAAPAPNSSAGTPLVAGCAGSYGGHDDSDVAPGAGGGAVQISASGTLDVNGTIQTNGGLGHDSTVTTGGSCTYGSGAGGGGSAGDIVLEGSAVTHGGTLAANGGRGGNGSAAPCLANSGGLGGAGGTNDGTTKVAPQVGGVVTCTCCDPGPGGGGGAYGYVVVNLE